MKHKTKPRRVDFYRQPEDFQVAMLGALGYSDAFIQSRIPLSRCQIYYRLRAAKIRRADYRNGNSAVALRVLNASMASLKPLVMKELPETTTARERKPKA